MRFALPLPSPSAYMAGMVQIDTRQPVSSLPHSFWEAARRGVCGHCPRCGGGRLFRKWLKSVDRCPVCMLDLSPQRADDFPAYIAILLTGHLVAPLIIVLSLDFQMGVAGMLAILIPLVLVMMLGMLQPAKGAVIAAQWWFGMHGFVKERVPEPPVEAEARTLP